MRTRDESARSKIVSSTAFIKMFDKARAKMRDTKRKACAHNHPITAANAHVGDMKRMGRYTCDPCNREAQARYNAAPVAAKVAPKRQAKSPVVRKQAPVVTVALPVPDDPQTSLKICLRTAEVEYNKLPADAAARGRWARTLLGAVATNFGILDFQVRRPVLVMDEKRAMPMMVQAANA